MTEDRKIPDPQNLQDQQNQTGPGKPQRGQIEDPLKRGMSADGGHILHGAGMSASAQQSGSGRGESSLSRNWDAGGDPSQDERGTVSTGPDTSPNERQRQQQVHMEQEARQHQQSQNKEPSDPNRGHEQPPLEETVPPDVLARDPDVTKR